MKTYDVTVIGAGLAGLQCARLLAERNLKVLLVDRKPTLDKSIHTSGIFVRKTLEDFALPPDCLGPPVRNVTLYSPARRHMDLVSPHDEFRVGRMGKLYERFLKNCIHAGVEWMPDTRFQELIKLRSGSIVRLETKSFTRWIGARFVVGADGANSRVAAALGLDQNHEWIVGLEEVVEDVPLTGPPRFHCFLDPCLAPGYLAWIVHDGEQVHIGVGGYPSHFDPQKALSEFKNRVKEIVDVSTGRIVEKRGGRIPVGGVLRRIANDRGLLVGDASGAVSPLTAGGLDPCMRLSTFAADVISEYLKTNNVGVLAAYSGARFRTRFVSRLWMRRILASVSHRTLIELGFAFLRRPPLNTLAWHVFFGRGSFPDIDLQLSRAPAVEAVWMKI